MARNELVELSGVVRYFKHITPEVFEINGKKNVSWKHKLWPNPGSLELIRELQAEGIKNVLKKDDDGYFINFSRPVAIEKKDGTRVEMGPPKVTLDDGTDLKDTAVGDGSYVTTVLDVYQHRIANGGSAKAARWQSSTVHTLVPGEVEEPPVVRKPTQH